MDHVVISYKGSALDYVLGQLDEFKRVDRLHFLIFDPFVWAHISTNTALLKKIKSQKTEVCFSLFVPFLSPLMTRTTIGKAVLKILILLSFFAEKFPFMHLFFFSFWKKLISIDKAKNTLSEMCDGAAVWFEWTKFSSDQEYLFEAALKTASSVNVIPDALVVDFYTMTENMKSLFSEKKVMLYVHNRSLKNYYEALFQSKGTGKVIFSDYKHSDWPMKEKSSSSEIRILYLCQKSSLTEKSKENLSLAIHKKRLTRLAKMFAGVSAEKRVKLIYRRQNIPQYFKLNLEMMDFCRSLGISVENGSKGCVFSHVISCDFILSEYTSASQYVKCQPKRLIFKDDGYQQTMHIKTIEEAYRSDLNEGIMISEPDVFEEFGEWLYSQ